MFLTFIITTCLLTFSCQDIIRERNNTLVEESPPLPSEIENPLVSSTKSSSDSESSDASTLRRRTTSIVEHVMISADQNTRSCENLLAGDNKIWNQNKDSVDGNYSDSELLNGTSIARKKSTFDSSHEAKITTTTRDPDDYDLPLCRSDVNRSPSRINEYDHLQLVKERSSGIENGKAGQPGPQELGDQDAMSLHRPTLPEESTLMKSFQKRNQRNHLYEDIDVDDERQSSSCSPESPSSFPTHIGKQDSYKRKISLLGREHCYESIPVAQQQQTSPSPPPSLDASPRRRTHDNSMSPSRFNILNKPKSSISRPTLPLQNVSLDHSFENSQPTSSVPSPSVLSTNRNSKKPIPTPRQSKNATMSDSVTTQDNLHTSIREPSYVNGSVIQEQINALGRPDIPPKPRKLSSQQTDRIQQYRSDLLHHERFSSSDDTYALPQIRTARMKPQSSLQDMPNYAQIYVQTEPASLSTRNISKLSQSTASKRYPATNYMQIDHFKTEQLQHLIEQRTNEKNSAAV